MTAASDTTLMPAAARTKGSDRLHIAIILLSMVLPVFIYLAGLRLTAYRMYFIVMAVPIFVRWLSGGAGRIRLPDILLLVATLWMVTALFINHSVESQWEFAGILAIETVVPYMLGRVLIRDFASFRTFFNWYLLIIVVLWPFALMENLTGRPILIDLLRGPFHVYADVDQDARLGLERAQVTFPHPILYGVFCAPAFAMSWYVARPGLGFLNHLARPVIVAGSVFSSLSSGALLGIMLQAFLMTWDKILSALRKRWTVLLTILVVVYVPLELASNRNVFQIVASELTFSSGTAWNRINIFTHSIDDIMDNPIFGIGLNEWSRPDWLRPSVDNFWLLMALRYGIPVLLLLIAITTAVVLSAATAKLNPEMSRARFGYVISILGIAISAVTVHLWDTAYCMFMLLLGAGAWFSTAGDVQDEDGVQTADAGPKAERQVRYTRFGPAPKDASHKPAGDRDREMPHARDSGPGRNLRKKPKAAEAQPRDVSRFRSKPTDLRKRRPKDS